MAAACSVSSDWAWDEQLFGLMLGFGGDLPGLFLDRVGDLGAGLLGGVGDVGGLLFGDLRGGGVVPVRGSPAARWRRWPVGLRWGDVLAHDPLHGVHHVLPGGGRAREPGPGVVAVTESFGHDGTFQVVVVAPGGSQQRVRG